MKQRIDLLLVAKRLVESRTKAQWLIRNGFISVDGIVINKPGKRVDISSEIDLRKRFPYVGRGGIKLEFALDNFSISINEKICLDIGASIGGFTDCLLKNGASKVYAIDTAKDILHPSLKNNPRVITFLGVDARKLSNLREKVDICTIDVTFTSVKAILPNIKKYLNKEGDVIVLIKPLFEIDFRDEKKLKTIKEPEKLKSILSELMDWGLNNGFYPQGIIRSPLLGKGGSIEFFDHFKLEPIRKFNYSQAIEEILMR
jgi:23S rRNA (cytidine1920-2'-O)/16S rRNA (cytidine1409-2'-O)-methyltransferase